MKTLSRAALATLAVGLALSCGSDGTGPGGGLAIVTDTLPYAVRTVTYTAGINANGGAGYTWRISSGSLPAGLDIAVEDLTDDDAVITGIPDATGDFTFTVEVQSSDGESATRSFTLEVLPPPTPAVIETALLPPGLVGREYGVDLRASGGDTRTYEWRVVEGSLPEGISLTPEGRLEGTATGAAETGITVEVESAGEVARRPFRLVMAVDDPDRFNLTTLQVAPTPGAMQAHLEEALEQWEAAITGDLALQTFRIREVSPAACSGFGDAINAAAIDDLLLLVNIRSIDGVGGVLGQAGPCILRNLSLLPAAGILTLDADDLVPMVGTNTLTYLLSHEVGHVLGIGSLWEEKDLVLPDQSDPRYSGAAALAEWQALGGVGDVPVEDQGGQGTREVHWRETVFDSERMTGYSEAVGLPQPLSRVTIASLRDLGYQVDLEVAEPYMLPPALRAAEPVASPALRHADVFGGPVTVVREDGTSYTIDLR